jgi:hypothetical protein
MQPVPCKQNTPNNLNQKIFKTPLDKT